MVANLLVYCLKELSDFLEFERFCSALLLLDGYAGIEPLGGYKDKGRDAIQEYISDATIFAYSVRGDWKVKLISDAEKVKKYGHNCQEFVFVTTANISANDRDNYISRIKQDYGWKLSIYGIERITLLLENKYSKLIHQFPSIFPPQFISSFQDKSTEIHSIHIISSDKDNAFIQWLSLKLISLGYKLQSEYKNFVELEAAISEVFTIAVISKNSNSDLDIVSNRTLIAGKKFQQNDFKTMVSILLDGSIDSLRVEKTTKQFPIVDFTNNWAHGLNLLLKLLEEARVEKPVIDGKYQAVDLITNDEFVTDDEENIYLNCFPIIEHPKIINRYKSSVRISGLESQTIQQVWPHRRVDDNISLSLFSPPQEIIEKFNIVSSGGGDCTLTKTLNGIRVDYLLTELLKKTINFHCSQKGLLLCNKTHLPYFPEGLLPKNKINFVNLNGKRSWLFVTSERVFRSGNKTSRYRYYLSPMFDVNNVLFSMPVLMIRLRLRITDTEGNSLPRYSALARRKSITRNWWNKEWRDRIVAIVQFLSDEGEILIGTRKNEVVHINSTPICVKSSRKLDELLLEKHKEKKGEINL